MCLNYLIIINLSELKTLFGTIFVKYCLTFLQIDRETSKK